METTRNTDDLMRLLHEGALKDVVSSGASLPTFPDHLARLCSERDVARERVIQRAHIERSYGHQLFNGTRRPSRDKVIQLAFGFGLEMREMQTLLKVAGHSPLVPQVTRDAALLYCVLHRLEMTEVQKLLEGFDMRALGG